MPALLERVASEHEITTDEGRLISHYGAPGDKVAICGAPTLGIRAPKSKYVCPDCKELWDGWPMWRREILRLRAALH